MIEDQILEISPLAYMRGRTFKKFVDHRRRNAECNTSTGQDADDTHWTEL
jgi:hypothetical protein